MADPTLRILATLDDPERYVRESGVPVFVPHVRRGEDGEVEVEVTPDDLQAIAQEMQRKLEEYGTLVRVTRGHVVLPKPDEPPPPEDEQPPIWGWAKNPRVGAWGPEQKTGLLVDIYFQRDKHEEAMGYPFRSAEYYPETNEITGIALLRRDPELDMGLLTYARRDTPERGQPEVEDMPNDDFLDDVMEEGDEQEQYADDLEGETHQEPDGDEFSPEEAEQYARMCRYMHKYASDQLDGMGEDDEDRAHIEQMARAYGRLAYGAGEPAGGNAFVPGTEDLDEPPMDPIGDEEEMEPEMEQMGRGGKPRSRQYGRQPVKPVQARQAAPIQHYEKQMKKLQSEVQELKRDRALLHYEKQLLRLEQQGVDIDIKQELADALDMTEAQRKAQLRRIAKHYARSPVGGGLVSVDIDDEVENTRQRPMNARQKAAAVEYAQRAGVSYEQAMEWARKNVG